MPSPIITIVGSFVVGMTLRTPRMPVFGETLMGSDFDLGPGGKGSNQAVGVARLGGKPYLAGIIGTDRLSTVATELYASEAIDTTYLRQTEDAGTGIAFIILNQAGENGIIIDPGANSLMDAAFVDSLENQIAASDIVMSVLELPVEAAARAMQIGRNHGVRTILNPAPATRLGLDILSNVDYLTPNDTELRILLGLEPDDPSPTPQLAEQLRSQGVANLIVTRGERGALIASDCGTVEVPGVQVNVVDTTGAGDAFNAGLAVALAEGKELVEAVKSANCAGAFACTALGVVPALGTRQAIDELFAQFYL